MQKHARRVKQVVAGLVIWAAMSVMAVASASADSRQMLWQSRDQFVALEPLEQGTEGANTHPVDVSADTLSSLFAAIDVRIEDAAAEPLFTQESLQALVPRLQQALGKATAREDVTFAIIGLHSALYGLAKSPMVTTGRVFRRDGHLNLIVGMAHAVVNEREDRRLAPFVPGSRRQARNSDWQLLQRAGQDAFTLKRKDWVVFSDAPQPATITRPEPPKYVPAPASAATAAPAAAPQPQAPVETRSPVDRMIILNELKNKGLITDEEYRGKRQQILNGL